jgi:tRNA(Arg) A34 adenosine deaminase TadA
MRQLIDYTIRNFRGRSELTGCFIVKGDKLVSKTTSSVEEDNDPTAHAEINAIKKYCSSKKDFYLKGCWIYSTQIPCPMCTSAITWAEADGIVWGWDGRHTWDGKLDIHPKEILKKANKKIKLFGPFLEEECLRIKGYTKKK